MNQALKDRELSPTVFDARDLSLSFHGQPPTDDAEEFQSAIEACSGVIIATPEYHGSFSAMTKLILENLGFPSVLADKPVALVGVAAGRIGAVKSLERSRVVCSHVGTLVLPGAVSVAGVQATFYGDGTCIDEGVEEALRGVAVSLFEFIENYVCPKYTLEAIVRGEDTLWTSTM